MMLAIETIDINSVVVLITDEAGRLATGPSVVFIVVEIGRLEM